jgi:hypothetical protein
MAEQFTNIPEDLTRYTLYRLRESDAARKHPHLAAADALIRYYVDINVFEPSRAKQLKQESIDELVKFNFPIRVLKIASTLFDLRMHPAFAEFCRRLKERPDLRSAYFEMYATDQFRRAGFIIDAKREVGKKGLDFDFSATRAPLAINVEVRALEEKVFSEGTIPDRLNYKRGQLPPNSPGIIYMALPERWDKVVHWDRYLGEITRRFFAGTGRINAVVFAMERHLEDKRTHAKGAYALITKAYENTAARIRTDDLSFLSQSRRAPLHLKWALEGVVKLEAEKVDAQSMRDEEEFFRWVDHLIAHG